MATINNKTSQPLKVPLPRGKTLHLGPGNSGQIADADVERPAIQKMIEAGQIEIVGDDSPVAAGNDTGAPGSNRSRGPAARRTGRRSGDR